jgi:hypothetical protein
VIAEIDVWRTARLMVKTCGTDAAVMAAERADALLAAGDGDGYRAWKRILTAIAVLQRMKPGEHETIN